MRKKSLLSYLLAILALVIWGHNGYKIFRGLRASESVATESDLLAWKPRIMTAGSEGTTEAFVYRADYRDPFRDWLRMEKKSEPVVVTPKKEEVPPPALRLTGILKDPSGTMAIIETPGGEIHFVRERDQVEGLEIVAIDSSAVRCRLGKEVFRVELKL